jgi:hypothetical protein
MLDYLSEIENGDVSAPKFVDVHTCARARTACTRRTSEDRDTDCRGESALESCTVQ